MRAESPQGDLPLPLFFIFSNYLPLILLAAALEVEWSSCKLRWRIPLRFGCVFACAQILTNALSLWRDTPLNGERLLNLLLTPIATALCATCLLAVSLARDTPPLRHDSVRLFPLLNWLRVRKDTRHTLPSLAPGILKTFAYTALALTFSYGWLWLGTQYFGAHVHPKLSAALVNVSGTLLFFVQALLCTALAPFLEEIVYRGYLQGLLSRIFHRRAFMSVVIPAILWALPHVDKIEPNWVKWGQIFGVGLVLGVVRRRLGLEACIAAHLALNVLGFILMPAAYRN